MAGEYKTSDKVSYVLANDYRLLQVMSRFGISFGFGEKTIKDVCQQRDVDADTFIAVINYVKDGAKNSPIILGDLSVKSLLDYLKQTHAYFLDYQFPMMRRNMLNAIDCSVKNEVAFLVLKFFDSYVEEVRKHMEYEEKVTFSYVEKLLSGDNPVLADHNNHLLSKHHESIDHKLRELKNLFIQYYPQKGIDNELNAVIYELYRTQCIAVWRITFSRLLFADWLISIKLVRRSKTKCRGMKTTCRRMMSNCPKENVRLLCVWQRVWQIRKLPTTYVSVSIR